MEEGKADELYRLFKRTDEGARFKQGLGFGAGAGAAAEQPWQRGSAGAATGSKPTSLSSMFVKAGQAPTAPPQQPTQQHPAAAADAAARVAARMAQLKQQQHREQRQQDEDDDDDDNRRRRRSPGAAPRRSRSRSRSRDRRDRSSHHHHHRSRSRSRDRSRDRRRSRSRSRDRDSRRWRDRSRSQDEPRRRDRPDRDRNRARGSSRERQRRETPSGSAAAAAEAREDYRRLIPSYDRLTPAEQLRARTALALERADASSRKREAAEAREGSGAVVRPWTRYIFNTLADLDEAAGAGGGGSTAGAGVGDVREVARELGIDAEEERLRAPQQSLQAQARDMRKRDDEHASAIFGKAPAGGEGAGRGAEATAGGCLLKGSGGSKAAGSGGVVEPPAGPAPRAAAQLDQEALASVLEGRQTWGALVDEDGPVLVLESELALASGAGTGQQRGDDAEQEEARRRAARVAEATVASDVLSHQRQLGWRERAAQARQGKEAAEAAQREAAAAAAAAAAQPITLQMSWRDKAKARGGGVGGGKAQARLSGDVAFGL